MKYLCFLMFIFPVLCHADILADIKDSLKPFQPLSVSINDGNALIIADEHRVTDSIYKAIINNGICMSLWLGNDAALDGIKSVTVLNKHKKQGYVFEGGKDVCTEIGKLKTKQANIYLMAHTSIH